MFVMFSFLSAEEDFYFEKLVFDEIFVFVLFVVLIPFGTSRLSKLYQLMMSFLFFIVMSHHCHCHVIISSASSHGFVFHHIWIVKVCFKVLYN